MSSDQRSRAPAGRPAHLLLPLVLLPSSHSAPSTELGPPGLRAPSGVAAAASTELRPWIIAVSLAADPCLVLDVGGRLVASSAATATLVGRPIPDMVGRLLVPELLSLIDFTAAARPGDDYVDRIPPLLVLRSGAPARGLLRIRRDDGSRLTLDAVAAPLRDWSGVVGGSVCFLAAVPVS